MEISLQLVLTHHLTEISDAIGQVYCDAGSVYAVCVKYLIKIHTLNGRLCQDQYYSECRIILIHLALINHLGWENTWLLIS